MASPQLRFVNLIWLTYVSSSTDIIINFFIIICGASSGGRILIKLSILFRLVNVIQINNFSITHFWGSQAVLSTLLCATALAGINCSRLMASANVGSVFYRLQHNTRLPFHRSRCPCTCVSWFYTHPFANNQSLTYLHHYCYLYSFWDAKCLSLVI